MGSPSQKSPSSLSIRTNSPLSNETLSATKKLPAQKNSLDVLRTLSWDIKIMKKEQENQKYVLDEILQRLKNKGVVLSHPQDMPQIPIATYNDLKKMELSLDSQANAEYLTKRLSQEGGHTVSDTTDFVCKKAIKRSVAKYFSLRGRVLNGKKKKTFTKLNLYKVIKDAVFVVHPGACRKSIDDRVGEFLRLSPFRKE